MRSFKYTLLLFLAATAIVFGQDSILTKQVAVDLALEYNYDIQIAQGNVASAANNASILNSGYLPSVAASGGGQYNVNDNYVEYQDGTSQDTQNAETYAFNGSVSLSYTLFNGLGRRYNYARLKENYNLSELQARQVIENSILNLFAIYYEVARLSQNINSQLETLDISKRRLQRAKFGFEYGQNSQLDVLNAEVDLNNDSITYLNLNQELENVKRDINVLLGRDVNVEFSVDTAVTYMIGLDKDVLMEHSLTNNVEILQNENLVQTALYNLKINKSAIIPNIGLSAAYNYNDRFNDQTSFFKHQTTLGPTVGANLTWNIFDGGSTRVRIRNAQIEVENQEISLQQTKQILMRNVNNAWGFYQTALFVLQAEKKNLQTNELNFERTLEQQKLGQITSIEFRQAQLNLLNAQQNYNQAKFAAKTAELALLQLSGDLMLAVF